MGEEEKDSGNGSSLSPRPALVGRALDAAVAERVMKEPMPEVLTGGEAERAFYRYLNGTPIQSPLGAWRCHCIFEHGDVPEWLPRPYSTDIAAAMEVVETMRRDHEFHEFNLRYMTVWMATFKNLVTGDKGGYTGDLLTSPAAAICLAALLATASASVPTQQIE